MVAHFELAKRLIGEGDSIEALAELRRRLTEDPEFLDANYELAKVHRTLGQYREAFPYLDACISQVPGDFEVLEEAAEIKFLAGEVEKATTLYESLHLLEPENEDIASIWVAIALVHEGAKKALKKIKQCLEVNPNWVGGYLYLGNIQELNGRLMEAEEAYQRALDLMPDHRGAKENLDRLKVAGPLESTSLSLTYDEIFLTECSRLRAEGSLGRTAELMEHWHERFPEHPLYRKMLAEIYKDQGQFHLALQLLREGNLPDSSAKLLEASLLTDLGKQEESLALLEGLREMLGADPEYLGKYAEALLSAGRKENALKSIDQGLEIEPEDAALWFLRGKTQKKLGLDADCHDSLQRTVAIDPDHPGANFALGIEHLHEGRDREAVAPLQRVVNQDPERVEGWRHLAIALTRVKDYAAAVEPWSQVVRLAPGDSQASGNLEKIRRLLEQSTK